MSRTTASLVIYNSSITELQPLLESLHQDDAISAWIVVDNGAPDDSARAEDIRVLVEHLGGRYIATGRNLGFGAGHNTALKALAGTPSDFHLMLNPDISYSREVLPALARVMDAHPNVGLIMPKVVYPDGANQYLCKLLPTPLDIALRRFAPGALQRLARERMDRYELRAMDSAQPAEVPFLSGCFMFARRSVLNFLGGFDERYFLYMEDVDLCRRFSAVSSLLYWPDVSVTHEHQRGSHKSMKLMLTHVRAAIVYFNKWGWLFDPIRKKTNHDAIARLTSIPKFQSARESSSV
jgi:GT2 family glycosyltransferase